MKLFEQWLSANVPRIHAVVVNAMHACKILKDYFSSVLKRDVDVVPLVPGLHRRGRPTTIAALVMPIHIDAVEGGSFRSLAHVGQKVREVCAPLWRHPDAATAVVRETFCIWVLAPVYSTAPCVVFGGKSSNACAVAKLNFADRFAERTSTALAVTGSQLLRFRHRFSSAIADAMPRRMLELVGWSARFRNQPAESLAC